MRRLNDTEAPLWYCELCFASGVLLLDDDIDKTAYAVIEAITLSHAQQSPKCRAVAGSGGVRIARPESWYRDVFALESPSGTNGARRD